MKFYNKYTLSVSLSRSIQFGHLYRKLHEETEGLFWEKAALNPLVYCWSVPFEFSFCEGPDLHMPLHQTNEQTLTTSKSKNLNLLTITFLAVYLMTEVNLRTRMNRRWEWIILSVRSLVVFEENIVETVLAKLFSLFFKCSYAFFCYAVSNWQVSDCDRYL